MRSYELEYKEKTEKLERQRHGAFKADFLKLMREHNVVLVSAKDYWGGYPECGQDIRITVEFGSKKDEPWINDLDLGQHFYT